MTRITIIAAVGRNRAIGREGDLPWHISEDLKRYKAVTMGHAMVMGRKTFESIGRALPGRRTVVLTSSPQWHHPDVEVAHSFPEALSLAGFGDEVFIAGGSSVYAEAMPMAQRMLLTEVDESPEADTFFPEFSTTEWHVTARQPREGFDWVTYEKVAAAISES